MKLRMKGHSIRLRLSQTDMKELEEKGLIQEETDIGPGQSIIYSLQREQGDSLRAEFKDSRLAVYIPSEDFNRWTTTDLVGLDGVIDNGQPEGLSILIEKDFQCLHKRAGEDDSEGFPNPLAP